MSPSKLNPTFCTENALWRQMRRRDATEIIWCCLCWRCVVRLPAFCLQLDETWQLWAADLLWGFSVVFPALLLQFESAMSWNYHIKVFVTDLVGFGTCSKYIGIYPGINQYFRNSDTTVQQTSVFDVYPRNPGQKQVNIWRLHSLKCVQIIR